MFGFCDFTQRQDFLFAPRQILNRHLGRGEIVIVHCKFPSNRVYNPPGLPRLYHWSFALLSRKHETPEELKTRKEAQPV